MHFYIGLSCVHASCDLRACRRLRYSASSLERPLLWFFLLLNVFSCKNVIMKAIILKSELLVEASFISLFASYGRSSPNGYVVIAAK